MTYPMKARIRNEGSGPARVDIFDDIGAGGWFSDGFTPASFADAIKGVSGPLDIHINSGGGDVADGIAIASAIRGYPGPKRTVVDGMAASIASVIAQAGDERIVEPGAMLMIHDPLTGLVGNADEMRKTADTLDKHGDNLAQQYADRAGGTAQQWRDVMKGEAWYTADEAVAAGLADRVGTAAARLPQGLNVDELAAHAPARIMAVLRAMPRAAAPAGSPPRSAAPGAETPVCRTCEGRGTVKHPSTGQNTLQCPGCQGTGLYDPGEAAEPGGEPDSGMQDRVRSEAGKPYEPQPYKRASDENTQCPKCQKFSDDDARYCGQCGTQLAGRTDVREAELPPATNSGDDRMWAFYRLAVRDSGGSVDNSPWDGAKAMASGASADDPAAFYKGICAGRKDGDAATQDGWALPYKYHPGDAPNAAGVKNALARLPQTEGLTNEAAAKKALQAAMKQVNPDWEPEDGIDKTIFSQRLKQMRGAMPPLKGADE